MKSKESTRTITIFLGMLASIAASYAWEKTPDGEIQGRPISKRKRRYAVDPLTAVANEQRRRKHDALLTEPSLAARELQLSDEATSNIIKAVNGKGNRGHHQVLRGKIAKTLGL